MLTHRLWFAGMAAAALTVSVAATASAGERHDGRSRRGGGNDDNSPARFASGPTCDVPRDGHVQFTSGRSPFRGSSRGAYGEIFFASGGTTVAPAKTAPPAVGGAASSVVPPRPGPPAPPAGGTPAAGGARPTVPAGPIAAPGSATSAVAAADTSAGRRWAAWPGEHSRPPRLIARSRRTRN